MSAICPHCNAAVSPLVHFCPRCGAPASRATGAVRSDGPLREAATRRAGGFVVRHRIPLALITTVASMLMIGAVFFSLRSDRRVEPVPVTTAVEVPEPVLEAAGETEIASLTEVAQQYELLQVQADNANRRIAVLLTTYRRRGGSLPPNFGPDLDDTQRALLAERIAQERSGVRNLLQEILEKDAELTRLRSQATELQGRLPTHIDAREGDRHDRIAMDFLRRQGVSAERAYQLVSQMNTQEVLLPGFRVWTYYENGQFGTWVTRGSAPITPQEHQRRLTAVLEGERDQAVADAAAARRAVVAAGAEIETFMQIAEAEQAKAENANKQLGVERQLASALEREQQAVLYSVGARRQLARVGAITNNMRQVLDFERAGVLRLDPTGTTQITIDGSAHGLSRIRRITLLPQVFDTETDIETTLDGPFAVIRLLNVEKFRQNRFIIVLE